MSTKPQILFIVEGERLERKVIERMAKAYGFQCEISSVRTTIYDLYVSLKNENGFLNVVPALKEMLEQKASVLENNPSSPYRDKELGRIRDDINNLSHSYSSIYLIFDSELQHHDLTEGEPTASAEYIAMKHCDVLKEMLEFFDNETDQGKLYVNYPMMESYRDCDDYFDITYRERIVSLDTLFKNDGGKGYKELVSRRKKSNIDGMDIKETEFNRLICMNVFKLNYLSTTQWRKMDYDDFRKYSGQTVILEKERGVISAYHAVSVLNTSLFFAIDYKGREFYDASINP